MFFDRSNWSVMRVLPSVLCELISVTPEIVDSDTDRSVAIAEPRPDDPQTDGPNDRYARIRRRERSQTHEGTGWA